MEEVGATYYEYEAHRYPPTKVKVVQQFHDNIDALVYLFKSQDPYIVLILGSTILNSLYVILSAYEEGLGDTSQNTSKSTAPDYM